MLTEDLGIHMTLEEYDRIPLKRIKTIIDVQQRRLEQKARRAKIEEERRAREAARNKIMKK